MNLQPYISGYYDVTKYVLEKTVKADSDLLKKTAEPYWSINIRNKGKKEIEKEAEERRFKLIRERQKTAARSSNQEIESEVGASAKDEMLTIL